MAIYKQILIGKLFTALLARIGAGVSDIFALQTRTVYITWQTTFDVNPAAVNITLEVSLDAVNWTVVDTTTAVGGEVRVISPPFSAAFIRANVVTNTGDRAVTLTLLAKAA